MTPRHLEDRIVLALQAKAAELVAEAVPHSQGSQQKRLDARVLLYVAECILVAVKEQALAEAHAAERERVVQG